MADLLITLAVLFLLGLSAHWVGLQTHLPRASLLILIGIAIGPSGFDLFVPHRDQWFPIVSDVAMVMLGFLLGGSLTNRVFREHGSRIITLSLGVAVGTFLIVLSGLLALGQGFVVAIILAALATATDPAATSAVLMENNRQNTPCGETILGIVAIDDAWGLLLFSFCLVIATGADASNGSSVILKGIWETFGAILLGLIIGLPMAYLTGRIQAGEPILVEALGLVFLCGGLALKLEVSHLLASIVMGATVANLARHHTRPFHAIEGIEWPFLVLFFILAGASLDVSAMLISGVVGAAYLILRVTGKVLGGIVSAPLSGLSPKQGGWSGFALLPQAGVAVAMALTASQSLPTYGGLILTITLTSTVIFELLGPVATRIALGKLPEQE